MLFILFLLNQVLCGRVRPYGARALTMSNVNPNGWSEYNFTMVFDTTLPSTGILIIEFPEANYPDRLGLRPDAVLYAPYPTTRTYVQNDRSLEINLGEWPINKPLTVTISGIINSQKQGGTGNFKVYTKLNSHIVDINRNFAVIGLADETLQLLSASMSISDQYAGEVTDYVASLQPSQDLQSKVDFIITFPDLYVLSGLKTCSCNVFVASCTVHQNFLNQILITGNSASILKGTTVNITFNDITNPSRQMKTPLFNFRVIERGTNNTLQQSTAVNGLNIMAGKIKLVSLSIQYYQPYIFFIRDFTLQFRPKNGFQYAKIATDFYEVLSCQITRGLLDPSQFQDSICNPLGKVMFLSNFQSYIESDYSYEYLEVRFKARIGSDPILTNPIQIYTYKDQDYLYLADKDILSVDSQIQIIKMPALESPFGLSVAPLSPSTSTAITITFLIAFAATPPPPSVITNPIFGFEVPLEFSGVPECTIINPSYTVACEFRNGYVNFTTPISSYTFQSAPQSQITITGLITPDIAGSYSIGAFIIDGSTVYYNNITLIITPPQFGSSTGVYQLSNHQSQQTAVYLSLEFDCNVAAGIKNMEDPYVPFTTIEVYFYQFYITNNVFDYDLGSGLDDLSQYGCQFEEGFTAITGKQLSCVLFQGTNTATPTFTDYAMVKVQGFTAITASTSSKYIMSFKIPVKYPSIIGAIPRVRVDLVYYNEKVKSIQKSQSFNIGAVKNQLGNSLVTFSGPVLENPKLQVETTLTYKYKTTIGISLASRNGIYFELPSGFTFNQSQVLISIDGVYQDSSNIQYFPTFIFIKNIKLSNGILHTMIFERVNIPVSLSSVAITHSIKTINGGQFIDAVTFTIPTLTKGSLLDVSASISTDYQNHPYVNYSIAFTTSMKSYAGSKIVVDFPVGFDIQASNAYLDNIPYTNLKNSTTNKISYDLPTTRKFRVLNFQPTIKGQRVSIAIYSVKNPIQGVYTLTISILDSNDFIIEDGTQQITIGSNSFITQTLTFASVNPMPNNKKALGLYTWIVNTNFPIPKLSEIRLTLQGFSSVYSVTPDIVSCRIVQDSTIPLRECLIQEMLSPPEVQITTDYLIQGKQFQIEYYGYLELNGPNGNLGMSILYNGNTIASGTCPVVAVTDELVESNVTLDFYPKNEGEIAYYTFTLSITTAYNLTTDKYILIRFPFEYDYIIGIEKMQVKSNTLQGALKMSIIPYHIKITGFYALTNFVGQLDIILLGVINPNRLNNQATGTFLFGIMNGNQMVLGKTKIDGIIPQLAPQLIQLNSIISSVKLNRYTSTYNFQIHPFQKVLATVYGGQIYVDFPNNFIIDSFSGGCETTSEFSFFASCKWDYFRFLFVTNNQDWYADSQGDLSLTISNVLTPDDDGETNNFIIYNYDQMNKIVLGRTYANLHQASITYSYDGLQIDVNYKQPFTLEVGSYSDEIIVNITDKADFTLTLSPNVLDSQIIITPNPVQIVAGTNQATFRVAAPRTILLQTYYIQWSKTGDTLPVTYAPLRLTPLQMVKGTIKRKLTIEQMEYMPRNGTSYPLYITTNNPPYQQLLIRIGFKLNTTVDVPLRQKMYITDERLNQLGFNYAELVASGQDISEHVFANLSTTQLEMSKLQYQGNYTLNVSTNYPTTTTELDGKVYLTLYYRLRGYDADSFELNTQMVKLQIKEEEYRKPKILETKILSITRSTATFQVSADIYGFIFFVYADQHMPDPIFDETRYPNLKNVTLSYSNPVYGVAYVRTITTFDVNFTITNLSPNHDYEIFLFVMNLNKIENPKYSKVYFQTMKSQSIALITLKINQATIDSEVKMDYIQKMAEMVGITKARLQERTTQCKQTTLDVSTSTSYMFWNLMILPDPTNMNEYTKPLVLGQTLNSRRTEIQKFITRLDDEPFYTLEEIAENIPSFVVNPEMIDRTTTSISVRFTVSYCGKAYLTFRERTNSSSLSIVNETIFAQELKTVQFPSAYQIKYALNESNQPINQTTIAMQDTDTYYQYNYTDLNPKTVYDVYISLENDFPTSPELFSNDSVARFTAKTQKIISSICILFSTLKYIQYQCFKIYIDIFDYFNFYFKLMQKSPNIPGYQLGQQISKTLVGPVYQCTSTQYQQKFLIKIIPYDKDDYSFLQHEQQILQKFNSPNIIKCLLVDKNQEYGFSVFEWCEKENLETEWKLKNNRFTNENVEQFCLQMIDALTALQTENFIYGYLRLENIFIQDNIYKLSNLEASIIPQNIYSRQSKFDQWSMAPEILEQKQVTSKCDIFSLGCLMFQLLTGYLPFTKVKTHDDESTSYIEAIKNGDLQLQNLDSTQIIVSSTYALIKLMVKYDPNERPSLDQIKEIIEEKQKQVVFKTVPGPKINDWHRWGQLADVDVFETQQYTPQYFKVSLEKINYFYEVSQSFGGVKFYNYQKPILARFMLYKKAYICISNLITTAKVHGKDSLNMLQKAQNEIKQLTEEFIKYIRKEQNLDFKNIHNWNAELNLDESERTKSLFDQALEFAIEYYMKSQLPYSKQKETPEALKTQLKIFINLKNCQNFNPFSGSQVKPKKIDDLSLEQLIQMSNVNL